jgi:hypothetical protein
MVPLLLVGALLLGAGLVAYGYGAGSGALFYGGLLLLGFSAGPAAFRVGHGRWQRPPSGSRSGRTIAPGRQRGRAERLAGNILDGIRPILLEHPRLHCEPRH